MLHDGASGGRFLCVEGCQALLALEKLTVGALETSRTSLLVATHALILRLALVFWPKASVKTSSALLLSRDRIFLLPNQLLLLLLVTRSLFPGLLLCSFLSLLPLLASRLLSLLLLDLRLLFGADLLAGFLCLCFLGNVSFEGGSSLFLATAEVGGVGVGSGAVLVLVMVVAIVISGFVLGAEEAVHEVLRRGEPVAVSILVVFIEAGESGLWRRRAAVILSAKSDI